ncbi:hypothetical protein H5410_061210 [Solanum commersonii]|uniref:Protein kinase domain-containing protein n=1 Tax=Solanum commersonii TaxID=4109 RepID=A0A9J5W890_SOLCO|nr:hypothetical protein H5410_061210 [Solanum commersonii]
MMFHYLIGYLNTPKVDGQNFMNEVATIRRIHHVNVVGLVGYSVEGTKRALVYMTSFPTDQSTSILAHVKKEIFEFGLAKLYPTGNSIVNLTVARRTIGYISLELINRSIGETSYKANVYSFGMLLMEMLDLKRNEFNKRKDIVVGKEANDDETKMAIKLSLVALWCIQANPIQHPWMSRVLLEMLEGEVEVLEVPPQPIQYQPIVHLIIGSCMTYFFDPMGILWSF